jgi:peroxin-12
MEYINAVQSPVDTLKPSLFEILAEQQLAALLAPSVRYLLAITTHRYPRYLLRILNNFDEVYALLGIAVERYYLRTFGGSFTENFYSLKRERVVNIKGGEIKRTQLAVPAEVRERLKLQGADIWKNLAVLVGVPYLKRKLDESYDIHIAPSASLLGPQYADRDALPPNPTFKQRTMWYYKWFLRNVYPSVNAGYYFSILAFSLGYMFDQTKYSSPFLWLINTRMRRMGEADFRAIEAASEAASKAATAAAGRPGQGLSGILSPRTLYPRLLSSLRILLPTSIFALKFLEWWHQSDFSRQLSRKAAEGLELPPPIVSGMELAPTSKPTTSNSQYNTANSSAKRSPPISSTTYLPILTVPPPPSSDLCPICLHPIQNPAACQTGYVFDYKCIFQWIQGNHERQDTFMKGEKMSEWEDDENENDEESENAKEAAEKTTPKSRVGQWESGKDRCAVTGRRVLGGTSGLRRVLV